MRAVPPITPIARGDEQLCQRGFWVEVVELAVGRFRRAELNSLHIVVGVDRKIDLVEDLAVGGRQEPLVIGVAAVERVREAADRAGVALGIDRSVRNAVRDRWALE